jgi:hypothetical protein
MSSHDVNSMFSSSCHNVPNMFFKFPLYSLTRSQKHLIFISYDLNVVLFSSIYIVK